MIGIFIAAILGGLFASRNPIVTIIFSIALIIVLCSILERIESFFKIFWPF